MPLIKREVEPVFVSQVDIGRDVKDELECVTNYTLSSIIRQLGNLGKHAEDIFADLLQEATSLARRAGSVQDRLDKLGNTLDQLDPMTDAVSLRDINTRLAFKSSLILDAEVVSSSTMPSAMKDTYVRCEQPPPLSLLNQYRQDGKDGLKFYTDPKFFFERWKNEQHKDIDQKKKRRKKQKRPQSSNVGRPRKVLTTKEKYKIQAEGAELADIERERKAREAQKEDAPSPTNDRNSGEGDTGSQGQSQLAPPNGTPKKITPESRRKLQRPKAPAPSAPTPNGSAPQGEANSLPPPPPMDDDGMYADIGAMPPPPPAAPGAFPPPPPGAPSGAPGAPPPPPPPPVAASAGPTPPPPPPIPGTAGPSLPKENTNKTSNPRPTTAVPQVSARDDLLSAIKQGMQLRRVEVKIKDRPAEPENESVEAILRRRIAVELSDDDDGSSYVSDDSDWDDED